MNELTLRDKIWEFEAFAKTQPQVFIPLYHHFSPGLYIREVRIPVGTIAVGLIHKHPCLSVLVYGEIITQGEDGELRTISAPFSHHSPPGMKRIGLTTKDTIWMTYHENPYNVRDMNKLEAALFCDTEEEYQAFLTQRERSKCLL